MRTSAAVSSPPAVSDSIAVVSRSTSAAFKPDVSRFRFSSSLRSTATVIEVGLVMTRGSVGERVRLLGAAGVGAFVGL
jgi:hypothetical protein